MWYTLQLQFLDFLYKYTNLMKMPYEFDRRCQAFGVA